MPFCPLISPDDFLGQFIAQRCKKGVYLDEVILIEGISERSNGRAFSNNRNNPHFFEFIEDSIPLLKGFMLSRSLDCWPALTVEHFLEARKWQDRRILFLPSLSSKCGVLRLVLTQLITPDYYSRQAYAIDDSSRISY